MTEQTEKTAGQELEPFNIFKAPLCLISSDKDGMLTIEEHTIRQLEEIHLPVNVVAIAGLYRTGKSYLMNRLAHVNTGFPLGNTTESKTKGIWIWCKEHPTQNNQMLVLLDTEGLGDVQKGDIQHDNKIFTLATLLSSTLVYNMMGTFNQDAVEKLTFITEMSSSMRLTDADPYDKCFDFVLPRFVLCLRDFCYRPEDNGTPITPDEYLDVCLRTRQGNTPQDLQYNRPRECIKKYFTRRKVFTFDRPGGKKVMTRLDDARDEELSEDFLEDTIKFTSYVFNCEPKLLWNKHPVTGSMLAQLIRSYIQAMKEGAVPCVDDAMTTMTKIESDKAVKSAVNTFRTEVNTHSFPILSRDVLLEIKYRTQTRIMKELTKKLVFDDDGIAGKRAEEQMDEIFSEIEKKNAELVEAVCLKKLSDLYQVIHQNDQNGKYNIPDGYREYKDDMSKMVTEYHSDSEMKDVDANKRAAALQVFEMKMKMETEKIMEKDKQMSEAKWKKEIESKAFKNKQALEQTITVLQKQLKQQSKQHDKEKRRMRKEKKRAEQEKMKAYSLLYSLESSPNIDEKVRENKLSKDKEKKNVFVRGWKYLFGD